VLAIIRLLWRFTHQPPALPDSMPSWQQNASHLAHWSIYLLIFLLPISGWLMSSASAYSVSWFNLFVFPDLVGSDKALAGFFNSAHELLSKLLLVLVLLHVIAALKHHFIDQDGVLGRMATIGGWVVFVISIIMVLAIWGRLFPNNVVDNVGSISNQATVEPILEKPKSSKTDLPFWKIDYDQSFIRFTGDQAGAPFTGEWTQWSANMYFDENQLSNSQFDVEIQTSNVDSGDQERDDYIVGSDFFDTENYETAYFQASEFVKTEEGRYQSDGQLSIKGLSKTVLFVFSVKREQGQIILQGHSTIDRLSWNIGTGDWTDPTWVGHDVKVEVRVVASE